MRANIYELYLLHSHARNSLINYISNIVIINCYHHYDLQNKLYKFCYYVIIIVYFI